MEYVLIIGHDIDFNKFNFKNKYIIGVDEGAYIALKEGIKLDLAIGDFDSVNEEKFKYICENTSVIQLPIEKDDTDTLAAVKYCKNAERITILGGIQGKRIEHFVANMILMQSYPNIEILDNNSYMYVTNNSITINKNDYKYISFFAINDCFITLDGFKYPLRDYYLKSDNPLAISNEIINDKAIITLRGGKLMIIQTKEDKWKSF